MRIAYYTPLSRESAIGRAAVPVAEALADRGHEIRLIRSEFERSENPAHPTKLPVSWWHDVDVASLASQQDLVLANIGDHHGFHAGVFSILDHALCVGIFHDFYLYDLFRHWAVEQAGGDLRIHDAEMARIYGAEANDLAALVRPDMTLAEIAERFPMTEWVAERCAGALVHSNYYRARLEYSCAGPVAKGNLPYAPRNTQALERRGGDAVTLLTIGHANPNKCCSDVIDAIGHTAAADEFAYRIAGPITQTERDRLQSVAAAHGFAGLTILGAVSDQELEEEIGRADIICCLRKPVLEGASASAIEAMLAGRPIVVADAGFYADLPRDMVGKVPADVPLASLAAQLDRLRLDEDLRIEMGHKAASWAARTFTIESYVDILEGLAEATVLSSPLAAASVQMARSLSRLGLNADDPAVGRIGAVMQDLFDKA